MPKHSIAREIEAEWSDRATLERLVASPVSLAFPLTRVLLQRRLSELLGDQVRHVDVAPNRFRREDH